MTLGSRWLLLLQCSIGVSACGDPGGQPCTRDDECPSGFCKADGTCGVSDVDASAGDAPADASSGLCSPNHDGQIALAELPLIAGRMATFRIATNATFDTAGTVGAGGARIWDLTGQLANDADRVIALASPAGAWWAASFPSATYAAPLASGSDLAGVFRVETTGVLLLGVVSPNGGAQRTELAYDPPAKILGVPIDANSMWSSTSTISGTAIGVPTAYTERYLSRVDHVGTMKTPYGEFPVLRAATDLTRTQGLATLLTKRSFAWIAECFGSVATVSSQDFESSAEFNDPAEVRRLVP